MLLYVTKAKINKLGIFFDGLCMFFNHPLPIKMVKLGMVDPIASREPREMSTRNLRNRELMHRPIDSNRGGTNFDSNLVGFFGGDTLRIPDQSLLRGWPKNPDSTPLRNCISTEFESNDSDDHLTGA